MSYPFENAAAMFRDLIKPLSALAHTDDRPFDADFASRLPTGKAYAFDEIKKYVCAYRSAKARLPLRSADALLIDAGDGEPSYYLVDFKNQKVDNIQSLKDADRNELMQKAFDSLTILSMTFGCHVSMRAIQKRSTFIVVYPQQDYSARFLETLNQCADGQPLWNLDKLTANGFYADVKTIHDGEFSSLFLPYMS